MAGDDSAQEKTEEPTSRKLEKAREQGQAPRSRELTTSFLLLAGSFGLLLFGGAIAETLFGIMRFNFDLTRETIFDNGFMLSHLAKSFYEALLALAPIMLLLAIACIAGPLALGGWLFSASSLAPKLNRIDPMAGLKRMFSVKSLVELVKSIGKVLLVMTVAFFILTGMRGELLGLSQESLRPGVQHMLHLCVWATIILSAVTIFITAIDVPYQLFDFKSKLKMSRQDIKDELKDTEGKPEVKGRIRMLQHEMARKRMMSAVPQADVVITNPTHFSVALKYDPETMRTPIVLAKGIDHTAMKIREIAKFHKIDFVQAPLLARAIYHTTEVEGEVPQGLYVAVAQVLAYVFQLREFRKGRGNRPDYPRKLDIPAEMRKY